MGYRLNRLDEPVFMAVSKPMQTEFGIHHILESCGNHTCIFSFIGMFVLLSRGSILFRWLCRGKGKLVMGHGMGGGRQADSAGKKLLG